jgi:hypothetical protein
MKMQPVRWIDTPKNALNIYSKKFRNMSLDEIEKEIDFETKYKPQGYTGQLFCWTTATVFITKPNS